jgi:hypothetical protein
MSDTLFEINQSGMRGKIVELLSYNEKLSAKKIYFQLKRQQSITSTYQAIHKTLKQMVAENILIKEKNVYQINPNWVEVIKQNVEQLSKKINSEKKEINLNVMEEGQSIHLNFKGILDVGWFLVNKLMVAPNPNKKTGVALWRFCYSVVGLEEKHLTGLKIACSKNKWIAFVEEDNKVDRMFGETLLSYGLKNVKFGVKGATPLSDKMIIGDFVAEIVYPSFFRKLWAIQNRLPQKIVEFNLAKHFLYMRELQPDIEVILTKNAKLAEEYRKEYLKK